MLENQKKKTQINETSESKEGICNLYWNYSLRVGVRKSKWEKKELRGYRSIENCHKIRSMNNNDIRDELSNIFALLWQLFMK